MNGRVFRFDHGDYHAGKGVAFTKIKIPSSGKCIRIYSTHTIAQYSVNDHYHADRISQMWELGRFIQMTSNSSTDAVVLLGDLNSTPSSLEFQLFQNVSGLIDTYSTMHPEDIDAATHQDISVDGKWKRLDHIFISNPHNLWVLEKAEIVLKSDEDRFYSDHFGVEARLHFLSENSTTLQWENLGNKKYHSNSLQPNLVDILQIAVKSIEAGGENSKKRRKNDCIFMLLVLIFLIVIAFVSNEMNHWIAAINSVAVLFIGLMLISMLAITDEVGSLDEIAKEIKYFYRSF